MPRLTPNTKGGGARRKGRHHPGEFFWVANEGADAMARCRQCRGRVYGGAELRRARAQRLGPLGRRLGARHVTPGVAVRPRRAILGSPLRTGAIGKAEQQI